MAFIPGFRHPTGCEGDALRGLKEQRQWADYDGSKKYRWKNARDTLADADRFVTKVLEGLWP